MQVQVERVEQIGCQAKQRRRDLRHFFRLQKTKERSVPSFDDELKRLNLAKPHAIEAQRMGTLPDQKRQSCGSPATVR
jgi:hypothetical protein